MLLKFDKKTEAIRWLMANDGWNADGSLKYAIVQRDGYFELIKEDEIPRARKLKKKHNNG